VFNPLPFRLPNEVQLQPFAADAVRPSSFCVVSYFAVEAYSWSISSR